MSFWPKSKAQKAREAERAEHEKYAAEYERQHQEQLKNRQERLKSGQQVRRIYDLPHPGAFREEWNTSEGWAQKNKARQERIAKEAAENAQKYAPLRRAREQAEKNAEIARCRKVIAEANTSTGGNRTKKYRKNKNKNTRRKH